MPVIDKDIPSSGADSLVTFSRRVNTELSALATRTSNDPAFSEWANAFDNPRFARMHIAAQVERQARGYVIGALRDGRTIIQHWNLTGPDWALIEARIRCQLAAAEKSRRPKSEAETLAVIAAQGNTQAPDHGAAGF
jgi:hypothetical protein